MNNLDKKQKEKDVLKQQFNDALKSDNPNVMAEAFVKFADGIQSGLIEEAKMLAKAELNDFEVMKSRGMSILTQAETEYYNEVIAGNSFDGVEKLMPPTVFERVFEDLLNEHELLRCINFVNTTATTEWIVKVGDIDTAWWGTLSSPIKALDDEGFTKFNMSLYKLGAFIPVSQSMLTLGPVWIDKYVRTVLGEAMAIGIERAVISGTGKEEPIGMIKDLDGAVVGGVYPDKTAVPLTDFSPLTFGQKIVAPLTKNGKRKVGKVLMVVNPLDYWQIIFPRTTILNTGAQYKYGVLPFPADIVQSAEMPKGKLAAGIARRYFMGIGSERRVRYSDEVRIIEDERVYVTKLLGNGRPLDNESFLLFDISSMSPAEPMVPIGGEALPMSAMTVTELKTFAQNNGVDITGLSTKTEIKGALTDAGYSL